MARSRVQLRGLRLLAIGCDARDGAHLQQQCQRLGVDLVLHEELPPAEAFAHADLILFDGDNHRISHPQRAPDWPDLPRLVLTSMETPSRLQWIIDQDISGYLRKPIRSDGVMTALTLALSFAARQQAQAQRIRQLEQRIRARRFLFAAQLQLIRELGLDEDRAYGLLRSLAMQQQKTVEDFCVDFLAQPERHLVLARFQLAGPSD